MVVVWRSDKTVDGASLGVERRLAPEREHQQRPKKIARANGDVKTLTQADTQRLEASLVVGMDAGPQGCLVGLRTTGGMPRRQASLSSRR